MGVLDLDEFGLSDMRIARESFARYRQFLVDTGPSWFADPTPFVGHSKAIDELLAMIDRRIEALEHEG